MLSVAKQRRAIRAALFAFSGCLLLLPIACEQSFKKKRPGFDLEIVQDAALQWGIEVVVVCSMPWDEYLDGQDVDWSDVLTLRLSGADAGDSGPVAPIAGRYSIEGNRLRFRPAFPLLDGKVYGALFDPATLPAVELAKPIEKFTAYRLPRTEQDRPPKLAAIYPTAGELPENHLKFYLDFTEPMRRSEAFEHVKLVRDDGEEIPEPFRETELWSEDGRRLTLWFHPGRQKREVNLYVEIGKILEESRRYRLVVSGDWKSEDGVPLGEDRVKEFLAGPPDRDRLDVNAWRLTAPPVETRDRLKLFFPEPYDWVLLQKKMWVEDGAGDRVPGVIEIGPGERTWFFIPDEKWRVGATYRVAVETVLEDLAGNSLARPFEVDLEGAVSQERDDTLIYLTFDASTKGHRIINRGRPAASLRQ